jgi:transcriptional regulator with XRE-family HTH domain
MASEEEFDQDGYGRRVGTRLRLIRRQKRLSLQDVEAESSHEFKASVLGAYERGERAISVPRLNRLAAFYRVPVDQLLPGEDGDDVVIPGRVAVDQGGGVKLDVVRVEHLGNTEGESLLRYLRMIQVQRQDFNGKVITVRRDDLRAIAAILGVGMEQVHRRLDELDLRHA